MGLTHGTTTGYSYYKCRCELCREALNAYQRERDAKKKAGTWQPNQHPARKQCTGPECDRLARYLTPQPLCGPHYQQLVLRGVVLSPLRAYRPVKDGMKKCRLCEQTLPVDSFYWQTKGKKQSACIDCTAIYTRARRYGLSFDETKELMTDPICAGCGRELVGRALFIDHDHDTGKIRGVLCPPCNTVLMDHMTPALLRRLAKYLEK